MEPGLLELRGGCFSYGRGEFALRQVDVRLRAGEVLGIIGPNGSGKSTLLRLLGGLLRPDSGQVLLDGRPLRTFGRRELARRVSFLPQSAETAFRFNVREVVAMGRFPHQGPLGFLSEGDVAAMERCMAETDVARLADRTFNTLSGGERQRALVASVLAQEPDVMLLDEPAAALDIHHKSGVMDLLWTLSRKGMAVALVTHDLDSAGRFCDRLLLMADGRRLCVGPPGQVMRPGRLSEAYGADVRVLPDPLTGTPMAIVPGKRAHDGQ